MYVLIAYDVRSERTERFRKTLSRYLMHEQNSVFAGDLPMSELKRLRADLSEIAVPEDRLFEILAANRHNVSVSILRKNRSNGALEVELSQHHLQDATVI